MNNKKKKAKKLEKIVKGTTWNRLISKRGQSVELSDKERMTKAGFDPRLSFRK